MFYRKCRKCGCTMDPGEGFGNICDDCVSACDNQVSAIIAEEISKRHGQIIKIFNAKKETAYGKSNA